MIKNIFLLLLFSVLLTLTAAKYSFAKPAREKLTTAVTFGPVGLPIPGLRFHYRYSDLLSLNAGFSFMFAVGDLYFVEGGMGFGRSKSDSESEKTELVILQVGWFF